MKMFKPCFRRSSNRRVEPIICRIHQYFVNKGNELHTPKWHPCCWCILSFSGRVCFACAVEACGMAVHNNTATQTASSDDHQHNSKRIRACIVCLLHARPTECCEPERNHKHTHTQSSSPSSKLLPLRIPPLHTLTHPHARTLAHNTLEGEICGVPESVGVLLVCMHAFECVLPCV